MLKSLWKRCWKMTFAHCYDHNFWSIKNIWVRFISLKSIHPGIQFEHKFCLIWTQIEWVMIVWSRAIRVVRIRVSEDACVRKKHASMCIPKLAHTQAEFLRPKTSLFRAQSLPLWWDPVSRPFGMSKIL